MEQIERKVVGQCDKCHTALCNDDPKSVIGTRNKGRAYGASSPIYLCAKCAITQRTGKSPRTKVSVTP